MSSLYTPDRNISRKVREYDPDLFLQWNNKSEYWELWRTIPFKDPIRVTCIVNTIYSGPDDPPDRTFTTLDERILVWLYNADTHRWGGVKSHLAHANSYLSDLDRKIVTKFRRDVKDFTKDATRAVQTKLFAKGGQAKKKRVNWNKEQPAWIDPDMKSRTSSRVRSRSRANAQAYFKK